MGNLSKVFYMIFKGSVEYFWKKMEGKATSEP